MSDIEYDIVQKTFENLNHIKDKIPKAIQGFSDLSKAALQDGKLNKRMKEIIALAIAIAVYSKGCMKFHLQSLIKQQFSQDELIEIIAIVTYINGGSGLMSSLKALNYFEKIQHKNKITNANEIESENADSHNDIGFRDNVTKGYD